MQNSTPEKMKVLCLHGYRQSGDTFRSKLGSFRKTLNKYAEFIFITAPHQAPPLPDQPEYSSQKSWWFNKDDGTFKGTNQDGPAIGFEESLKLVEQVWENEGPFQGLLGFSQGACFVGLLCGLRFKHFTSIQPQFVIISSGFRSGSLVHKNFYEENFDIPSIHIYGENDDIIPKEMSEELSLLFDDPKIILHPGGHFFPANSQQKQEYGKFLEEQLQIYLENKKIKENSSTKNTVEKTLSSIEDQ